MECMITPTAVLSLTTDLNDESLAILCLSDITDINHSLTRTTRGVIRVPKYYGISKLLKPQTYKKIETFEHDFGNFRTAHQLPNTGNAEMTLGQLSHLLTGDDNLAQFDIVEGKVNSFLTDTQVGFLKVKKLYDDIVVGVVIGEYDPEVYPTYQEFIDEQLATQIGVLEDEGFNEFILTVAGRHRCVGLLTICDILGINPDDVVLSVLVKTYETWEEAALAVLCSNKSRSMTPAERTNCLVNSQGINTMNLTELANHASQGIKNAKESFALAASNLVNLSDTTLTRNTVSNVAKAFITSIGKTKEGKKVISYLSREDVLNALVSVFMQQLKSVPTNTNIARAASKIGSEIATNYLNNHNDVTLEQVKESNETVVIEPDFTDAF